MAAAATSVRGSHYTITKTKIKTNESPSSSVQSLEQRRVLVTSCPITRDFCTNDASLPDNCNCEDCGYPACGDCDCDYYGDGQCCTGSCTSWYDESAYQYPFYYQDDPGADDLPDDLGAFQAGFTSAVSYTHLTLPTILRV